VLDFQDITPPQCQRLYYLGLNLYMILTYILVTRCGHGLSSFTAKDLHHYFVAKNTISDGLDLCS